MTAPQVVDPWITNADGTPDIFASNVDWSTRSDDLIDPDELLPVGDPVLTSHEGLEPELVVDVRPPDPVPDEEPETIELEDGTKLILQKDKGWWVGSVVGSAGGAQTYKGETKNKLIAELLKAQANATQKIREQNKKLKLSGAPPKPAVPTPPPTPAAARQLTADEVFEYENLHKVNPAAALDFLLQKTRGVTVDQILNLAQQGAQAGTQANDTLYAEEVSKTFSSNNPDYYGDPEWKNFWSMVRWVAKFKLGEPVAEGNEQAGFDRLIATRTWNVQNLEEAFEDLKADGLLISAPRQAPPKVEPPPPVQVQQEPAPAPRPDSRIVNTTTRQRAAFGIQKADVTPVTPSADQNAPSAEDFENMTDAEIANTLKAVQRLRAVQNRRS